MNGGEGTRTPNLCRMKALLCASELLRAVVAGLSQRSPVSVRFLIRLRREFSMVGETGFEPATLCFQSRCATRLRYSPKRVMR